MQQTKN
jgi:hypothetical protein